MPKELPSPEMLRKLLRYDADTGKLYWRKRMPDMFDVGVRCKEWRCNIFNTTYAGTEAFTSTHRQGYKVGTIFGVKYLAHRVIWSLVYGVSPDFIDHINGITDDNRIKNLRSIIRPDNNKNLSLSARNKSGAAGVAWHKATNKWRAHIGNDNKSIHIGLFSNFEDAVSARKEAEIKYGYHENHGRGTKC